MPLLQADILFGLVMGSLFMSLIVILVIVLIIRHRRRQIENLRHLEMMKYEFSQTLLQTQLEIQEQTLKNISLEIHDNIGQALSLAKLNLNTMLPVGDDNLRLKIVNSKDLISKAIGDLRDLSHSLDTDYIKDMGLQRAIEYELEMIQKTGAINVEMQVAGDPFRLEKQKELILFRIVQETFNNILKHAEATSIRVLLDYQATQLRLQISDDGKGVDLTPLSQGHPGNFGLGIRNMHNRAKLIAGDFQMSSSIGEGTTIHIHLPLSSNHERESSS